MNFADYSKEAMRFCSDISGLELGSKDARVILSLLGLNGEVGELTDIYKKKYFHGHEVDQDSIKKEIGDVMWYMVLLCETLDIDMDEVMQKNIDKLQKRYDGPLTAEKSINRVE